MKRLNGTIAAVAVLSSALVLVACHKEEQAVVGVAQNAVQAEHKAQAAASERDRQRAAMDAIPLPTKSLYVDVHEAEAWANPFLLVGADSFTLRVLQPETGAPSAAAGSVLRPAGARRQQLTLRPADLAAALIALPAGSWRYGRVIAIAEAPETAAKDRPKVRRNLETTIKQLNDLGLVVEEWPAR